MTRQKKRSIGSSNENVRRYLENLYLCKVGSRNGQISFLRGRKSKIIKSKRRLWCSLNENDRYKDGWMISVSECIKDFSKSERDTGVALIRITR